jgi:hypothetical protein
MGSHRIASDRAVPVTNPVTSAAGWTPPLDVLERGL